MEQVFDIIAPVVLIVLLVGGIGEMAWRKVTNRPL